MCYACGDITNTQNELTALEYVILSIPLLTAFYFLARSIRTKAAAK